MRVYALQEGVTCAERIDSVHNVDGVVALLLQLRLCRCRQCVLDECPSSSTLVRRSYAGAYSQDGVARATLPRDSPMLPS